MENNIETTKLDDSKAISTVKQKTRITIYLTEEAKQAFNEIYIHRLRQNGKADWSKIACDAIHGLFEKECENIQ